MTVRDSEDRVVVGGSWRGVSSFLVFRFVWFGFWFGLVWGLGFGSTVEIAWSGPKSGKDANLSQSRAQQGGRFELCTRGQQPMD